jgi:GMP synthase-like glutamine amidotransferase
MRRALFLHHHLEDNPGLIGQAFVSRGYEIELALVDASSPMPTLDGIEVLVVLGSNHSVYDPDIVASWFARELDLMRDAVAKNIPILGICFGAQALCVLHGGVVSKAPEAEIGWYEVEPLNNSKIVPGPWFEFHFDRCELPSEAIVWATSPRAAQAFCVGNNVGVQFHPEIDDVQLQDWFSAGGDYPRQFPSQNELLEQTRRETPLAKERAMELVNVFLEHVAQYS